ncbi:MAG: response regulator transcription factor [Verrucomicrobiota bacterium]
MRILLAEDESKLAAFIERGLSEASYAVDKAEDGDEALWFAGNHTYDLVIMDVMMPGKDGFTVVRHMRRQGLDVPVLFLTARAEVENRVRGLDSGGDDYLTKPFSMEELLARVRALLRRQRNQQVNFLKVSGLEMDLVAHGVRINGKAVELTNKEYALLELLVSQSPTPVTKTAIVERVWNQHFDSGTNLINVYMNRLRGKIAENGGGPFIQTVRGVGFALLPEAPVNAHDA